MSLVFNWIMRRAPQLFGAAALLVYLSNVVTMMAAGEQLAALAQDMTPIAVKARAVVLVFVQPLVPALLMLFGSAVLWRMDASSRASSGGIAQ